MSQARTIPQQPAETTDTPAQPQEAQNLRKRAPSRLFQRVFLLLIIPAAAIAVGLLVYLNSGRFITTENAYLKSHIANVSPEVAGIIENIAVEENQRVEQGDLLFTLEDTPFRLALEGAQAELGKVETDIASDKRAYQSALSEITLHESTVAYARSQLARQQALVDKKLGREEDLDTARYELVSAERRVEIAQQQARTLLAKLNGDPDIPLDAHPAWRSAKMDVDKAELDLARTHVYAPFAGIVTNRPEPGAYAFPFVPAVAVVADEDMWIEANFKETQLTHMLAEQSVDVTVDAYPGEHWHGRVESIGRSTGAQFAMLPPQNATGNWVKIVQRVPVRIALDDDHPELVLSAGMSCEVTVDTSHRRRWRDLISGW